MSASGRLALFWRAQDIAVARCWALLERSGPREPQARIEFVIRSRYPEWSDAEVDRLLSAICLRHDPAEWLERLHRRTQEIEARLAAL
jgi:hypothetical protein